MYCHEGTGCSHCLQGAALSPWLGCKGRSQGRSQISGWVPREASAGPRRCFRRLSSFWKNLVRPNLFILLCPQDGIRCICCTWEKCSVNQWVMRPSGSTMLYVDMLSIYWSFIIGLLSSIYMKCFLYRYVWLSFKYVSYEFVWYVRDCFWLPAKHRILLLDWVMFADKFSEHEDQSVIQVAWEVIEFPYKHMCRCIMFATSSLRGTNSASGRVDPTICFMQKHQ